MCREVWNELQNLAVWNTPYTVDRQGVFLCEGNRAEWIF